MSDTRYAHIQKQSDFLIERGGVEWGGIKQHQEKCLRQRHTLEINVQYVCERREYMFQCHFNRSNVDRVELWVYEAFTGVKYVNINVIGAKTRNESYERFNKYLL